MPRRLKLQDERLVGHTFSGSRFSDIWISGCQLERCDFSAVRADGFTPGVSDSGGPSTYLDCVFDGAQMRLGPSGYGRFERCSFRNVDLRDWMWKGVDLVECTFTGSLRRTIMWGSTQDGRRTNEVRDNDLSGARLIDFTFRGGVDVTAQRMPAGGAGVVIADLVAIFPAVRERVVRWPDLDERRELWVYIQGLELDLDTGQRSYWFNPEDFGRAQRPSAATFAHILRDNLD
jgi:uncharacterized protein YjbI with pentapeptide repeats